MAHKTYPRSIQLGDLIEVIADAIPNEPALITNDVKFTFAELDERITRLANHLLSIGIKRGEHVGVHAQNTHEWVEAFYACAKISAVAINVNYRYVAAELRYLYDNADCVAVIADPEYLSAINDVRDALPNLRNVIVLGDDYEAALAAASPDRDFPGRTADDVYVLYTGGTTGMPKGVMWRHEDVILGAMNSARANRPIERIEQLGEEAAASGFRARLMSIGPMMHGGGQWIMGNAITAGGCFVLYTKKRFDAHDVWQLVADGVVTSVSTIGDAMARPLAEHLVAEPRPTYDLSMLFAIGNGGAPLSTGVREQIRAALPNVAILDSFGASETGAAGARADDGSAMSSPKFAMSDDTTVLTEEGRQCGVGEVGKLARSGNIPLGYFKDPVKTAETFRTFDGKRWVIPGDFAQIEDDGQITLLGRGSVCINSGGEKIYPEEVEAALKQHPAVFDAVVIGTPNARWGEQVTALVQLREGTSPSMEEIVTFSRTLVADYKSPKAVFFVPVVERTPVGKADYQWAKAEALRLIG